VRGLRTLIQSDLHSAPDTLRILNDFVRPKAQDPPTLALHRGSPTGVSFDLKSVMVTIDFDDEFPGDAREVGKVRADWMLPTEFDAVDPPITNQMPADAFGTAAVTTQFSGF
jgi:hypothetical protein